MSETAADLLLQLVSEITQTVHVHVRNRGTEEFYSFDLLYLIKDIAQRILRLLRPERLILRPGCFEFLLQLSDVIGKCCRRQSVAGVAFTRSDAA